MDEERAISTSVLAFYCNGKLVCEVGVEELFGTVEIVMEKSNGFKVNLTFIGVLV